MASFVTVPSKVQEVVVSVLKSLVLNWQFSFAPSKTLIWSVDCQLIAVDLAPSVSVVVTPITAFVPNPVWEALKLRVMSPFWELSGFSVGVMFSFAQPANSSAAEANKSIFFISIVCLAITTHNPPH